MFRNPDKILSLVFEILPMTHIILELELSKNGNRNENPKNNVKGLL